MAERIGKNNMIGKWMKRGLLSLIVVLVIAAAGFVIWTRASRYPATAPAVGAPDQTRQGWYVFTPAQADGTGLIIYPGGLVDPAAYAPLARAIAERGALVVITPMPLDLAVFGINSADAVIEAHPEVERWALAGHSLGGSMAAQYIAGHAGNLGKIRGLALWASYAPDGVDLSALPIQAVSIYGSQDGVMRKGMTDRDRLKGLPADTPIVVVEGGNHAGFGAYGPQSGDAPAAVSAAEQQRQAAEATAQLLQRMSR